MKKTRLAAALVVIAPLFVGCHYARGTDDWTYYGSSRVAEHWGEAYHANKSAMIENPQAAQENLDPVLGLDGKTGENVMDNYRRAATATRKPAPRSIININR